MYPCGRAIEIGSIVCSGLQYQTSTARLLMENKDHLRGLMIRRKPQRSLSPPFAEEIGLEVGIRLPDEHMFALDGSYVLLVAQGIVILHSFRLTQNP